MNASPHTDHDKISTEEVIRLRDDIINNYDFSFVEELARKFGSNPSQASRMKYLKYRPHVATAARRALALDLHVRKPLRMLDIGTGAGYFPLVCRHLGHQVMSMDYITDGIYNELTTHFKIPQIVHGIMPFAGMPEFERKFDVVTAFAVSFTKSYQTKEIWGASEWEFFWADVCNNVMSPDGILWFHMNPMYPNGERFSPETREFFMSKKAEIHDHHVVFKPAK